MTSPQERPSGFVAKCRCGAYTGAIDAGRTDRREIGRSVSVWLFVEGRTVEPRFGGTWSVELSPCTCRRTPYPARTPTETTDG